MKDLLPNIYIYIYSVNGLTGVREATASNKSSRMKRGQYPVALSSRDDDAIFVLRRTMRVTPREHVRHFHLARACVETSIRLIPTRLVLHLLVRIHHIVSEITMPIWHDQHGTTHSINTVHTIILTMGPARHTSHHPGPLPM